MPIRRQAIIWTNAYLVHWCIYAALGGDELIQWCVITYIAVKSHECHTLQWHHKGVMKSEITSNLTVCSTACYIINEEIIKSLHYWPFVKGIHWWLVGSPLMTLTGGFPTHDPDPSIYKTSLGQNEFMHQWYESLKDFLMKIIFKLILVIDSWGISYDIALRWFSLDLTDDKSKLVQVMAWCCQAASRHLSRCWPHLTITKSFPSLLWEAFNGLSPEQNGRHFKDCNFQWPFFLLKTFGFW